MITLDPLVQAPGIAHGFFTREGGVSRGLYASLNCGLGSRDDLGAVQENRRRVSQQLGLPEAPLITAYQVHGATVLPVTGPWPAAARPEGDALITDRPGVVIGVLTADCCPILFADPHARVVAATHAGWRGTQAGVIEATVAALRDRGANAETLIAAIGPTIRQTSYEVGAELRAVVIAADPAASADFIPADRPGHFFYDLVASITRRLRRAGITQLAVSPLDTYREARRLFSYRRATHHSEPDYGRQVSAIALLP